jgi:hypothetical protein
VKKISKPYINNEELTTVGKLKKGCKELLHLAIGCIISLALKTFQRWCNALNLGLLGVDLLHSGSQTCMGPFICFLSLSCVWNRPCAIFAAALGSAAQHHGLL